MSKLKRKEDTISISGIQKSFKHAFRGVRVLLTFERNLQIHITFAVIACLAGFYFGISAVQWMVQGLVIALVIFSELVNTSIEKILDLVNPEYDTRVKDIKDMAAGSVLFMALIAVLVGLIIYIPEIKTLL